MFESIAVLILVVLVYRFGTTRAELAYIEGVRFGRREAKERYSCALHNLTAHFGEVRRIGYEIHGTESNEATFVWRHDYRGVLTGYADIGGVQYEAFLASDCMEVFELHVSWEIPSGPHRHVSLSLLDDEISHEVRVSLAQLFESKVLAER